MRSPNIIYQHLVFLNEDIIGFIFPKSETKKNDYAYGTTRAMITLNATCVYGGYCSFSLDTRSGELYE